jgi:hypothetical protein
MDAMFIFNLQMKKKVSYKHSHSLAYVYIDTTHYFTFCFTLYTYLSSPALAAPQPMSPSLLSSQSRLNHSPTTWDRMLSSFPSIACLGYFSGLACPDLAADCCPNSNTYKSHRYTSRLNTYTHTQKFTAVML